MNKKRVYVLRIEGDDYKKALGVFVESLPTMDFLEKEGVFNLFGFDRQELEKRIPKDLIPFRIPNDDECEMYALVFQEAPLIGGLPKEKEHIDTLLYMQEEDLESNMLTNGSEKKSAMTLAQTLIGFKYKTIIARLLASYAWSRRVEEARFVDFLLDNTIARDFLLSMSDFLCEETIDFSIGLSYAKFGDCQARSDFLFYRDVFALLSEDKDCKKIMENIITDDFAQFETHFDTIKDIALEKYLLHCIEIGIIKKEEVSFLNQ